MIKNDYAFFVLLRVGDKIISDGGSQTEAVKAETIASCKIGVRGSLLHVMVFVLAIRRPVYSLYPDINNLGFL